MNSLMLMFSIPLLSSCFKHDHEHHHHHHDHKNIGSEDPNKGIMIINDPQTLGPHVHGEMNISIVAEGKLLTYELHGAADGMLGFEHAPRNDEEKQSWLALRSDWSAKNILSIFQFDRDLSCHVHEQETLFMLPERGRGNIDITGVIMCEEQIQNVSLLLNFLPKYPRLRRLHLEALPQGDAPAVSRSFRNSEEIRLQL